jgi:hypothetical protein
MAHVEPGAALSKNPFTSVTVPGPPGLTSNQAKRGLALESMG